jgi:hypothetical protein
VGEPDATRALGAWAVIDAAPGRLADWPIQRSTSTNTPAKQPRSSTEQRV